MRSAIRLLVAALALGLGASAFAATPAPAPLPQKHLSSIAAWKEKLARARRDVAAGKWQTAKEQSVEVVEQMKKKLMRTDGAGALLARAAFYRALAESALGEKRAAAWSFATALALERGLADELAAELGVAAPQLEALRTGWSATEAEIEQAREATRTGSFQPPRPIGVLRPVMPFRELEACVDEAVGLKFFVGTDGLPRHPVAMEGADPVFVFVLIDSVRRWSYVPARINGQPVGVEQSGGTRLDLHTCDH